MSIKAFIDKLESYIVGISARQVVEFRVGYRSSIVWLMEGPN